MAFSYWWWAVSLDCQSIDSIRSEFSHAKKAAEMAARSNLAYRKWESDSDTTTEMDSGTESAIFADQFSQAFRIPEYTDFGRKVLSGKFSDVSIKFDEDTVCNFLICRHCTPASIFFWGLGSYSASKLPGSMGNMLLSFEEIKNLFSQMSSYKFEDLAIKKMMSYYRLAGEDNFETVQKVSQFLIKSLDKAIRNEKGVLIVGMPEQ